MNDHSQINSDSGGYFLVWTQSLCCSANASWRVGPFASRIDAEQFEREIVNGSHRKWINSDDEPVSVVTEVWDFTPEEFGREVPADWPQEEEDVWMQQ